MQNQAGHEAGDETSAQSPAHALGYLPLALEQAAALIIELRWAFAQYCEQLHAARSELLSQQREGATRYPNSVTTTWRMTISRLSVLARVLLRIAAWFAPEEIPRGVFSANQNVLQEAAGAGVIVSLLALDLALGELRGFSLIRLEEKTIWLHRLVQAAEQDSMTAQERPLFLEWAIQLLNAFTPDPAEDVPTRDIWIAAAPHAETLIAHARSQERDSDPVAILAHGLGQFLISRAAFAQAEPLRELALTIAENQRGPNHLHVAIRLTNRALALKGLNRAAEAEALLRRAIDISEQNPNPKDVTPFVIQLSNLGRVLQDFDRAQEAEKLYRRALRLAEEQSPPDARLTGTVLDNLGTVLQETKRYAAAEPLHKRALDLKTQALGPNHPDVAATLNNLAELLATPTANLRPSRFTGKYFGSGKRPFFRMIPGSRWLLTIGQSYCITPASWWKPNDFCGVLS